MGDDITIGPIRDADTGEIETPASETGDGDGQGLGADNFDDAPETIDDQESDNGSSDLDDSEGGSTVVVPEDPAEREKLKDQDKSIAVGSGDTVEEARKDAAKNPDFDADTGDPVNRLEKQLNTNQPLQNTEGSDAEEIQQKAEEIAASDRFRGERTGRKAGKLAQKIKRLQQKKKQNRKQRRVQQENILPETANDFGQKQTEAGFRQNFINFSRDVTGAGLKIMEEGQKLGEQIGGSVPRPGDSKQKAANIIEQNLQLNNRQEKFVDNYQESGPQAPATTSGLEKGLAFLNLLEETAKREKKAKETLKEFTLIKSPVATEKELEAREDFVTGIGTFGTQLAGFGVAGAGSFGVLGERATRKPVETAEDLAQGTSQFILATGGQASQNPGQFVGQEVGEEVGEAAVGAAVLGPAGAALGATPTPTPETVTTPDTELISQAEGLITQSPTRAEVPREERVPDLGEQALGRDAQGVQEEPQSQLLGQNLQKREVAQPQNQRAGVPEDIQGLRQEEVEVLEQRREREPGVQEVESRIESIEDAQSQRPTAEEVVIETQAEELTIEETVSSESEPPSLLGTSRGRLELVEPETVQEPETGFTETTEGRIETSENEINLIEERTQVEPEQEQNLDPTQEPTQDTGIDFVPELGEDQFQINEQEQNPIQEQTPNQEQKPVEELVPEQENKAEPRPEPKPEPEFLPEIKEEPLIKSEPRPESERELRPTPESDFNLGSESLFEPDIQKQSSVSESPEAAPSVDAILFGDTREEELEDDTVFTGFEVREVEEDDIFNLF